MPNGIKASEAREQREEPNVAAEADTAAALLWLLEMRAFAAVQGMDNPAHRLATAQGITGAHACVTGSLAPGNGCGGDGADVGRAHRARPHELPRARTRHAGVRAILPSCSRSAP